MFNIVLNPIWLLSSLAIVLLMVAIVVNKSESGSEKLSLRLLATSGFILFLAIQYLFTIFGGFHYHTYSSIEDFRYSISMNDINWFKEIAYIFLSQGIVWVIYYFILDSWFEFFNHYEVPPKSVALWFGIFSLVIGGIIYMGVNESLEVLSIILGIIATIVGILVGLKKLSEKKEG